MSKPMFFLHVPKIAGSSVNAFFSQGRRASLIKTMTYDPIRNTYSITTFGDLIDNGYRFAVHCNGCGR